MFIHNFQDLIAWQKSHVFTLEIYQITRSYPRTEQFGLVSQFRRAATSICANIAEGYRKPTRDFARFVQIAQGSLEETKYYLILSRDLEYLDHHKFVSLFSMAEECSKILTGLRKKLIQRANN